jgi:hypothetical protein
MRKCVRYLVALARKRSEATFSWPIYIMRPRFVRVVLGPDSYLDGAEDSEVWFLRSQRQIITAKQSWQASNLQGPRFFRRKGKKTKV